VDRDDGTRGGGLERRGAQITPDDVQRKEFGTARVRAGYLMHEVDEFLDEITDTLSALLAENERLRGELAASPASRTGSRPTSEATSPAGGADRATVEAFLRREKAFLQSLGSLVQEHAEELKGMVRSARGAAGPAPVVATAPASELPTSEPDERTSEPATPVATPPPAAASEPEPAAGAAEPEPQERAADDAEEAEPAPALDDAEAETGVIETIDPEEPIRVDEPQPSATRRRDERDAGTLRELFWGEE
jgi:DivIVA domain-containing protein